MTGKYLTRDVKLRIGKLYKLGFDTKHIAKVLGISPSTAERYRDYTKEDK